MSFWFISFWKCEPIYEEANAHITCYFLPQQYWSVQDRDIQPESSENSGHTINTAQHVCTSGLVKLINLCVYCRQYTKLLWKFLWHFMCNLFKLVLIHGMSDICLPSAGSRGWCSSHQGFYQFGSCISFVFMFCHL